MAGYNFTITCIVTLTEGLVRTPSVFWTDSNGQPIGSSEDIMLTDQETSGQTTNRTLYFYPIRTSDDGAYTCMAMLSSPALSSSLNSSATYVIEVQQSKIHNDEKPISLIIIFFIAFPIAVMIDSIPDQGPIYSPGSTVILICTADGQFGPVTTNWTSTCSGNCFVRQQSSQESVMKEVLHSVDSGDHTCTITDDVGNTGNSTIEMLVSGTCLLNKIIHAWYTDLCAGVQMYVFDDDDPGIIPNNSIILTDNFGQIPRLQCISDTKLQDVGQWLEPSGQDITLSTDDPFDIIIGGQNDPGYLDISLHSGRILNFRDQGVYTCLIPDENGINSSLSVAIYLPGLTSMYNYNYKYQTVLDT